MVASCHAGRHTVGQRQLDADTSIADSLAVKAASQAAWHTRWLDNIEIEAPVVRVISPQGDTVEFTAASVRRSRQGRVDASAADTVAVTEVARSDTAVSETSYRTTDADAGTTPGVSMWLLVGVLLLIYAVMRVLKK